MTYKFIISFVFFCAALVLASFPEWTIDDAFIYYRYAENLANHGVLTWNVGESVVEGYTGVALPVILAGFLKLGFSPVEVSRFLGIGAYFLSLVFLLLIFRKLKINSNISAIALFLYASIPVLFTHATSGLDTMLFLTAMMGSIYAFFLMRPLLFFSALLFMSLVRPEGVVFSACLIGASAYYFYVYNRVKFKEFLLAFVLIYFVPALVYFLWRWNYYGQFLPNTFYVKTDGQFYLNNLLDLARYLRSALIAPLILTLLIMLAEADIWWNKIKKQEGLENIFKMFFVASAVFALILIILFSRTHLVMNYAARFYVPLLPLMWIVAAYFVNFGWLSIEKTKLEKPLRFKWIKILAVILVVYQAAFNLTKLKEEKVFAQNEAAMQKEQHTAIGKLLREKMPNSEWLVSYIDAGAIPYFSKLKNVDFGALNDIVLSRGKLSPEKRVDYFFAKNPGAAVFTSTSLEKLDYGKEAAVIIADARFKNYVLLKKYPSPTTSINYHEFLYVRKDLVKLF